MGVNGWEYKSVRMQLAIDHKRAKKNNITDHWSKALQKLRTNDQRLWFVYRFSFFMLFSFSRLWRFSSIIHTLCLFVFFFDFSTFHFFFLQLSLTDLSQHWWERFAVVIDSCGLKIKKEGRKSRQRKVVWEREREERKGSLNQRSCFVWEQEKKHRFRRCTKHEWKRIMKCWQTEQEN